VAPELTWAELELDLGVVVVLVDEVLVDVDVLVEEAFSLVEPEVDVVLDGLEVEVLLVEVDSDEVDVVLGVAATAVWALASARVTTTAPPPRRERPVRAAVAVRARRRAGRRWRGMGFDSELGIAVPIERGQVDGAML
jgi:hypothetical protein